MKLLKNLLTIMTLSVVLLSCSKDDETPPAQTIYEEENFLNEFLFLSKLNHTVVASGYGEGEKGLKFKSKVKGIIKAATLNLPPTQTNIIIRIWDMETEKVIGAVTTNYGSVGANNTLLKFSKPIEITPNKEYMLTFDGRLGFFHAKLNDAAVEYPKECGNITILGYYNSPAYLTVPPFSREDNEYFGDCSFIFQQVN